MFKQILERRSRFSIKTRIAFGTTFLLSIALFVGAFAFTWFEQRAVLNEIDTTLNARLVGIQDDAATGALTKSLPVDGSETAIAQVINPDNSVRASTPGLGTAPALNVIAATDAGSHRSVMFSLDGHDSTHWRVAALRVNEPGIGSTEIYAATSLEPSSRALARLRKNLLASSLLLSLLFGIASWFATRGALRPVQELSRTVETTSPKDIAARLPVPRANDEIAHLVRTTNSLLDRVSETRIRERRFVTDASHELRTPITTARLNLEIAQANPTQENLVMAVEEVLIEIDRLEILSRDLLELSRLDAERVRLRAIDTDIIPLLEKEMTIRRLRRADLTFTVNAPPHAITHGVNSMIVRVLRNLLNNAEKYASSAITVDVAVHERQVPNVADTEATPRHTIEVNVHNDGPPVPEKDRERIFEPFTRLDEARGRDDGGTGLGLAIVADILEAHRGTIDIPTDPRGGATFRFTLPGM